MLHPFEFGFDQLYYGFQEIVAQDKFIFQTVRLNLLSHL